MSSEKGKHSFKRLDINGIFILVISLNPSLYIRMRQKIKFDIVPIKKHTNTYNKGPPKIRVTVASTQVIKSFERESNIIYFIFSNEIKKE